MTLTRNQKKNPVYLPCPAVSDLRYWHELRGGAGEGEDCEHLRGGVLRRQQRRATHLDKTEHDGGQLVTGVLKVTVLV